jgi:hypothetical protein
MLPITINPLPNIAGLKSRGSENPSSGSEIEEARNLVRSCAEPRPVGDSVKVAIDRAADRLGFTYSRTKDIWYGDARRIDAREMDILRRGAAITEIDQGIAGLELLRARLSEVPSAAASQAIDGIDAVLRVLSNRPHRVDVEG